MTWCGRRKWDRSSYSQVRGGIGSSERGDDEQCKWRSFSCARDGVCEPGPEWHLDKSAEPHRQIARRVWKRRCHALVAAGTCKPMDLRIQNCWRNRHSEPLVCSFRSSAKAPSTSPSASLSAPFWRKLPRIAELVISKVTSSYDNEYCHLGVKSHNHESTRI